MKILLAVIFTLGLFASPVPVLAQQKQDTMDKKEEPKKKAKKKAAKKKSAKKSGDSKDAPAPGPK